MPNALPKYDDCLRKALVRLSYRLNKLIFSEIRFHLKEWPSDELWSLRLGYMTDIFWKITGGIYCQREDTGFPVKIKNFENLFLPLPNTEKTFLMKLVLITVTVTSVIRAWNGLTFGRSTKLGEPILSKWSIRGTWIKDIQTVGWTNIFEWYKALLQLQIQHYN